MKVEVKFLCDPKLKKNATLMGQGCQLQESSWVRSKQNKAGVTTWGYPELFRDGRGEQDIGGLICVEVFLGCALGSQK